MNFIFLKKKAPPSYKLDDGFPIYSQTYIYFNTILPVHLHQELQFSAFHNISVFNPGFLIFSSIEDNTLYVIVLLAFIFTFYDEFTSRNGYLYLIKIRITKYKLATGRFYLIESERRKDIPSRHLSYILITRQTIRLICIHGMKNLLDSVSRLPRLTYKCVQVNCMMTRFVTMRILANQSTNIRRRSFSISPFARNKNPVCSQTLLYCRNIPPVLLHREVPAMCTAMHFLHNNHRLYEKMHKTKRSTPRTVEHLSSHEARRSIKIILI